MIVRFANKVVLELYESDVKVGVIKYRFAKHIVEKYKKRIDQLISANSFVDISQIKSLNLEKLKGNRQGQFSIRVNDHFRICFRELSEEEIAVEILELTDYH